MSIPRKPVYKPAERVSKSRAFNASVLTILSLLLVVLWGYHGLWALRVMLDRRFGGFLNNLVFGPGTFVLDAALSTKVVSYINERLVEDRIDADHKKYL